jgi:hypothetical protein
VRYKKEFLWNKRRSKLLENEAKNSQLALRNSELASEFWEGTSHLTAERA